MQGIQSWGCYVPRHRLNRAEIGAAFRLAAPKGSRAVSAYDEDALTMGVEALRSACTIAEGSSGPTTLWFATTRPPYMDKGNASIMAAAAGLGHHIGAYDVGGSIRSGVAALNAAARSGEQSVAVLADVRWGRPGSDDDLNGGDAAAAFVFGPEPVAEVLATASVSSPLLDRWRGEGDIGTASWDERWSADQLVPLLRTAAEDALKQAGILAEDVDHAVVCSPVLRAARQLGAMFRPGVLADDLVDRIGYTGAAHLGVVLADVLSVATPGRTILVLSGSDGADAMVLRTTPRIAEVSVTRPGYGPTRSVDLTTYLSWRGLVHREPPRRPDPEAPASPAAFRNEGWKFSFHGSTCTACGARHLPPQRVCMHCGALDQMSEIALDHTRATVKTYTIDRLAYSPSPPVVVGVLDFDGGGRYRCQITDATAEDVAVGDRVEMTFRLISVSPNGIRNYFWKARPVATEDPS